MRDFPLLEVVPFSGGRPAESTENKLTIEVLTDIADEERVHASEFLRLLKQLAPNEEKFYDEGAKEVEEEMEKLVLPNIPCIVAFQL